MHDQLTALLAKSHRRTRRIAIHGLTSRRPRPRLVGPNGELTALMKTDGRCAQGAAPGARQAYQRGQDPAPIAARRTRSAALPRPEIAAQNRRVDRSHAAIRPDCRPGHAPSLDARAPRKCAASCIRSAFAVADGPRGGGPSFIVSTRFNTPADHPRARCAGHVFIFPKPRTSATSPPHTPGERYLLRTHTSSVQVRTMLQQPPPVRIVSPGRCFPPRHDRCLAFGPTSTSSSASTLTAMSPWRDPQGTARLHLHGIAWSRHQDALFRPALFRLHRAELRGRSQARSIFPKVNKEWIEIGGCGMVDPSVFEGGRLRS